MSTKQVLVDIEDSNSVLTKCITEHKNAGFFKSKVELRKMASAGAPIGVQGLAPGGGVTGLGPLKLMTF